MPERNTLHVSPCIFHEGVVEDKGPAHCLAPRREAMRDKKQGITSAKQAQRAAPHLGGAARDVNLLDLEVRNHPVDIFVDLGNMRFKYDAVFFKIGEVFLRILNAIVVEEIAGIFSGVALDSGADL
jgi:hypothetical protein